MAEGHFFDVGTWFSVSSIFFFHSLRLLLIPQPVEEMNDGSLERRRRRGEREEEKGIKQNESGGWEVGG